jgi:hypothetical protein
LAVVRPVIDFIAQIFVHPIEMLRNECLGIGTESAEALTILINNPSALCQTPMKRSLSMSEPVAQ